MHQMTQFMINIAQIISQYFLKSNILQWYCFREVNYIKKQINPFITCISSCSLQCCVERVSVCSCRTSSVEKRE